MATIFTKYVQKSKVFLFPLIDFKKGSGVKLQNSYFAWKDVYKIRDAKLICTFKNENDRKFKTFLTKYIANNNYIYDVNHFDDGCIAVFDLDKFKDDYLFFVKGEYSKMSEISKEKINKFFITKGEVNKYVDSYLYPADYHEKYAKALHVDLDIVKETHELCDKPDIKLETFSIDIMNNNCIFK